MLTGVRKKMSQMERENRLQGTVDEIFWHFLAEKTGSVVCVCGWFLHVKVLISVPQTHR